MKVVVCLVLVSATLLVGVCAAAPNLIVNGDFEILSVGIPPVAGVLTVIPGGSTALSGWTVTGDSNNSIDHQSAPGPFMRPFLARSHNVACV